MPEPLASPAGPEPLAAPSEGRPPRASPGHGQALRLQGPGPPGKAPGPGSCSPQAGGSASGARRRDGGQGRGGGGRPLPPRSRGAARGPVSATHPLTSRICVLLQSGRDLQQYQSQAKQLFRKLNEHSPTRCTLEAGPMTFHYIIERGVCYLVLCEASFPKKLAFAYLEDLYAEFDEQHGKKVSTVSRPYSFIEFDTYIQKTKKLYIDSRARRNLGSINTELQDVQRIMVANIEEVLQRGEALSGTGTTGVAGLCPFPRTFAQRLQETCQPRTKWASSVKLLIITPPLFGNKVHAPLPSL
uniref:SEC22 homolog B, vesicle trafficking protein (gene/pseudogene) n=1 Tax=Varanus komodoensis TaxID=61221 RepID=A0A8D2LHZ2_VARKO